MILIKTLMRELIRTLELVTLTQLHLVLSCPPAHPLKVAKAIIHLTLSTNLIEYVVVMMVRKAWLKYMLLVRPAQHNFLYMIDWLSGNMHLACALVNSMNEGTFC